MNAPIGMPDPTYGERVCVYLILNAGQAAPTVAELGAFLGTQGLAKFKWPERIEVMENFPVTKVGKVSKALLGLTIDTPIGKQTIREKDHQANRGQLYGKTVMDSKYPFAIMKPVEYVDPTKFMD